MSIVFERVDRTEVFVNESGSITIRQDKPGGDAIVCVPVELVEKLVDALRSAKEEAIE